MSLPVLVLKNQYGEESINDVLPGGTTANIAAPIATNTILANLTGGTAAPTAATILAVANKLPAKTGITAITALATADAPTQSASYVQADVQAIATLANDLKAKLNAILAAMKVQS